jgi:endonuclease G
MRKRDLQDKQKLQAAVRQVANEYLKDANINSVGLGYKLKDGKPTGDLALQFTVGQKFGPEALESVETRSIPETITANGIEFRTDVVERDFRPHPVAVAVDEKSDRKRRLDPLRPGISVANMHVSAGTIGCLVKENGSAGIRMLSNWHVLHGPDGKLGDTIVQPGPHDDNRIDHNACGRLKRSFLGLAGDCAIASIDGRAAQGEILDLGIPVRRIGDPELGDRLVKSGRTTAVTHGIVTRIHTITKIEYGKNGVHEIGGFEIGPDEERPAKDNEISMGGDSGAAWMASADDGSADDMMVGLHFAGETTEPAEYALACYASSVFEKLEIGPIDASAGSDEAVVEALEAGYDPEFLPGQKVALPTTKRAAIKKDYAPTRDGQTVRDYTHFSLAMSASRRFCRWVAWNIDGANLKSLPRKNIDFVLDDAYDTKYQVGEELYSKPKNDLDRGHIARRADLVWGTLEEARQANVDSFFFTNITPQLDDFNQSAQHGLWGELENAIFEDVEIDDLRLSVFGGPIFKATDLPYRKVLVPRSYWKVIAYIEAAILKAKAYVLTQDDLEAKLESLGLEPFKLYQTPLAELTSLTGLSFGSLASADTMPAAMESVAAPISRPVTARSEIVVD